MATATSVEREPIQLQEPRLTSPLHRLRRLIRTYAVVEGLAMVVMMLCLWFWATLFLDWMSYGVFNFDYVRDGDQAGIVKVIYRGTFLVLMGFGPWLVFLALLLAGATAPVWVLAAAVALIAANWALLSDFFGGLLTAGLLVLAIGWTAGIAAALVQRNRRNHPNLERYGTALHYGWMSFALLVVLLWVGAAAAALVNYNLGRTAAEETFWFRFRIGVETFCIRAGFIGVATLAMYVAGMAIGWIDRILINYCRYVYRTREVLAWLGGLVGLVAYKFVYRLSASFNTTGLALAVERRYPRVFGDRLMTSLELGDRRLAQRYGYSWVMIEQTRQEALQRIDQVRVGTMLNWSRLTRYVILAALMMVTVGGFAFAATDTTSIWWERNLAMGDRHWPRPIIIDLPDFRGTRVRAVPSGSEYRLTAEAWEYVVFSDLRDEQGRKQYLDDFRPAEWHDLYPGVLPQRFKGGEVIAANRTPEVPAWELANLDWNRAYFDALPDEWQVLTIDQVNVRRRVILDTPNKSDAVLWRGELGQAIITRTLSLIAEIDTLEKDIPALKARLAGELAERDRQELNQLLKEKEARLAAAPAQLKHIIDVLLPAEWRAFPLRRRDNPEGPVLEEYLRAARDLTPGEDGELLRLQNLIKSRNLLVPQQVVAVQIWALPLQNDFGSWLVQAAGNGPIFNLMVETKQSGREPPWADPNEPKWADPMFFRRDLTESDRALLPRDWTERGEELMLRLESFGRKYLPDQLGHAMVAKLDELFAELDRRAEASRLSFGKRRYFRKLVVPDEVYITWQNEMTEEEKRKATPKKVPSAEVKRDPVSYRYYYDKFGRIEYPVRFCVSARSYQVTPWHYIHVRPLPLIEALWKTEEWQPGYIYGSNTRVRTHPAIGFDGRPTPDKDLVVMQAGGSETVISNIPIGTQISFQATTTKPLSAVRVTATNQRSEDLWGKLVCQAVAMPYQAAGAPAFGGPFDLAAGLIATNYAENQNLLVDSFHFENFEVAAGDDGRSRSKGRISVRMRELLNEDSSIRLEFWDTDQIKSTFIVHFRARKDFEPAFEHPPTNPEHVRPQAISPLAVIPFTIELRDDYGLTAAGYEITVIKEGQKLIDGRFYPFRRFSSPQYVYGYPENLRFERGGLNLANPLGDGGLNLNRVLITPFTLADDVLAAKFGDADKRKEWKEKTTYNLGSLMAAQSALAGGGVLDPLIGLAQSAPLAIAVPRSYSHRHRDYPSHKAPIEIDEEFFDSAQLLGYEEMSTPTDSRKSPNTSASRVELGRKLPAPQHGLFAFIPDQIIAKYMKPPYQLQIRLVAIDNRVRPAVGSDGTVIPDQFVFAPQKIYLAKPFTFEVKDDNKIVSDEFERESALADRFKLLIDELKEQRDLLRTLYSEYPRNRSNPDPDKDDFVQSQKLVEAAARVTIEVGDKVENDTVKAFRIIFRDMTLSRIQYEMQRDYYNSSIVGRIDKLICQPLEEMVPRRGRSWRFPNEFALFDHAYSTLRELAEEINEKKQALSLTRIDNAQRKLDAVIERMEYAYQNMRKLEDLGKILRIFQQIYEDQKQLDEAIQRYYEELRRRELMGDPPPKP